MSPEDRWMPFAERGAVCGSKDARMARQPPRRELHRWTHGYRTALGTGDRAACAPQDQRVGSTESPHGGRGREAMAAQDRRVSRSGDAMGIHARIPGRTAALIGPRQRQWPVRTSGLRPLQGAKHL